jgi:asparagine synthase (glutamine-hydrolysing)
LKIFGIIDSNRSKKEISCILAKMSKSFALGDFLEEFFSEDGIGIGHLSHKEFTSNQMIISDSSVSSLCGNIHNTEELVAKLSSKNKTATNKNTEVIRYLFEEYGQDMFSKLNGIFVCIIYDRNNREFTIANDRYGFQPLYFYREGALFIFASEIKAIIATDQVKKEINWAGWRDLFSYGYVLGNKTLFCNISSLSNASIISIKEDNFTKKEYWRYENISVNRTISNHVLVEKGLNALKRSIMRQTTNLAKAQVPLSGGYDSRAIVCSLKKFTDVNFETFSSASHGTGHKDIKYAELLCNKLKIKNKQIFPHGSIYKEFFIDLIFSLDGLSFEHLWACQLANDLMSDTIVFDGIGGDLVFGEVDSMPFDKIGKFSKKDALSLIYQISLVDDCKLRSFFEPEIIEKIKPSPLSIKKEIEKILPTEYFFFTYFINNRTRNSVALISSNIFSRFNSRTRCFFPFMDNDLVDFSQSIPPDQKMNSLIYLQILRKAFPDAMTIPTTRDSNLEKRLKRTTVDHISRSLVFLGATTFLKAIKSKKIGSIIPVKFFEKLLIHPLSFLHPTNEDFDFLEKIITLLEAPPYINRNLLITEINKYKANHIGRSDFLVPIAAFYLWYHLFFKDSCDSLKNIRRRLV